MIVIVGLLIDRQVFALLLARKLLNCLYNRMPAKILDIASEIGMLYQTPSIPQKRGNISKQGSKKSSCRLSDMKMDFPAIPMLWKKLAVTIWKPMMGKVRKTMRMPLAAISISSSSLVKMETTACGNSSQTRNPNVVTAVARIIVLRSTSSTLGKRPAPKL